MKIDTESDPGAWEEHFRLMEQFNKIRNQSDAKDDETAEGS